MTRLPTGDVLTAERLADLQAFARGEQPELQPMRLRWHRQHGYLVPIGKRRAPHDNPVSRRISPRPHALTQKGKDAVTIAQHIDASPFGAPAKRPAQPRTGYQSVSLMRSVRR